MKNKKSITLRGILIIFFSAALIFSLTYLGVILLDYQEGKALYEDAVDSFVSEIQTPAAPDVTVSQPQPGGSDAQPDSTVTGSPEPGTDSEPEIPEPRISVDFSGLSAVNSDIFGWIYIPDTEISYPLLLGVDNSKYLNTAYNGSYSSFGSIFLDKKNSSDMSDRHSIIYGHNMKNGSMFGSLSDFARQAFYESHPFIYIITPDGYLKYEIFSAHKTSIADGIFVTSFSEENTYSSLLSLMGRSSWLKGNITPTTDDKVITLSTCTSVNVDDRFVVHAVLIEDARTDQ